MQVVPWIIGRFRLINTAAHGGETLADLALGRIEPPIGHLYASIVSRELAWPDLAQNDDVMAKLWLDSASRRRAGGALAMRKPPSLKPRVPGVE
jgi:hypothetical protein